MHYLHNTPKAMNKTIWILLLIAWMSLGVWLSNKYLCGSTTPAVVGQTIAPVTPPEEKESMWTYADGENHRISISDRFGFNRSEFRHIKPLPESLKNSLAETATYLQGAPERALEITGYYAEDEENTSILPNLGLARANDIKSYIMSLGVGANQITTKGALLADKVFDGDLLKEGIDFGFSLATSNEADVKLEDIKSRLVGKPITLYFGVNKNKIDLSAEQRQDFAELIYYLDRVDDAKLDVAGHTDNVGRRNHNLKLSKERAAFVQDYLVKNGGIQNSRMSVKGFGPDKPVASNRSDAGKQKNRRVEVTLN